MRELIRLTSLGMLLLASSGCGDVVNQYSAAGGSDSESGGSGTDSGGATNAMYLSSQSGGERGEELAGGAGGTENTSSLAPSSGGAQQVIITTVVVETGWRCEPGLSVACQCANSSGGAQVCNDDGKAFGPCVCEVAPLCVPNETVECACELGIPGYQICSSTGNAFSECVCQETASCFWAVNSPRNAANPNGACPADKENLYLACAVAELEGCVKPYQDNPFPESYEGAWCC